MIIIIFGVDMDILFSTPAAVAGLVLLVSASLILIHPRVFRRLTKSGPPFAIYSSLRIIFRRYLSKYVWSVSSKHNVHLKSNAGILCLEETLVEPRRRTLPCMPLFRGF